MNFDQAFDRLIANEGGYVNLAADPGGETKFGISKRSYPDVDIKNLTRDQAKAIYLKDFWLAGSMDQLPGALAFQCFDTAVNHGIRAALKMLQRAAGVKDDGVIGPVSLAAINATSITDMLMRFIAFRIKFWTSLPTWPSFGRGWANRAADNLLFAAEDS